MKFVFGVLLLVSLVRADIAEIKAAGELKCGTAQDRAMFGFKHSNGDVTGFDASLCQAVARTLGVTVTFVDTTTVNRFTHLVDNKIDILARSTTDTLGRRTRYNITFSQPYFFDGQGFLVKKTFAGGLSDITKYCVDESSSSYENAMAYYSNIVPKLYKSTKEATDAMKLGDCDVVTSDKAILAELMDTATMKILTDTISLEPLAMATRNGDFQLSALTTMVVQALSAADTNNNNTNNTWADTFTSIVADLKQVSSSGTYSYGSLYARTIGLKIPRANTKNDVFNATNNGKSMLIYPSSPNSGDLTLTPVSSRSFAEIKASGAVKCNYTDAATGIPFCEAIASAIFQNKDNHHSSSTKPDVVVGALYQFTFDQVTMQQPLRVDANGDYTTVYCHSSNIMLSQILLAVRSSVLLMDQHLISSEVTCLKKETTAYASCIDPKKKGQAANMLGQNFKSSNNFGFGDALRVGFTFDILKLSPRPTLAIGGMSQPYTNTPGVLFSTVWNGEVLPTVGATAGNWKVKDLESSCNQYYLNPNSTATNVLFWSDDDDNICFETLDTINGRGTSTCIVEVRDGVELVNGEEEVHSYVFSVNSDGSETYATHKTKFAPGDTYVYPSSFIADANTEVTSFERCTPAKAKDSGGASTVSITFTTFLALSVLVA